MRFRTLGVALALALIPASSPAAEKRRLPDYDGRNLEKGDGALWIPRVALFPLWLVSEYVIRAPVGAMVRLVDRSAADTTPPRDRWDVRPILYLDAGFRPRFGAIVTGNSAKTLYRLRADTFGPSSYAFGGGASTEIGRSSLETYGELAHRPDTIFHGFGPRTTPGDRVRVPLDRAETGVRFVSEPHPSFLVRTAIAVRGASFRVPVERDYVSIAQAIGVTLDLRPLREVGISVPAEYQRASGVRIDVDGELAGTPLPARRWISWGGSAVGMLDVFRGRVFELAARARFVDPIGSSEAPPYVEHATLGGDYLRGHLAGRLFGRSSLVTGVTYRWPVWIFLDGFITVEAGNVFDTHLRDISPKLFRLAATSGVRNTGTSGYVFEMLAGVGTEPIADGAKVSSVRLLLSASRNL
jgi:hypothetical protein